jgi:hypothetical protein
VCQQNSPTQKTETPHNVQQGAPNLFWLLIESTSPIV